MGPSPVAVPAPTLAPTVDLTSGFETGYDGWTTGDMDEPFHRHSGSTVTPYTGPSAAAGGIYYMYANTDGVGVNSNFDLQKMFPAGQDLCGITFQYHMYGDYMGSVVLESSINEQNWVQLWSKSGNMGNQWFQATAYASSGQNMLRFT